ncbi:MAG TPA: bacteriohemerythrin, partial [Bacteroidota bacterium]|nr:bacteriohemerythrin [Bacteroidota bacterium]
ELVAYTKVHFQTEEDFFKKFAYPGYAQHKTQHDKLAQQVLDFQQQYKSGRSMFTIELMNFLKNWLSGHILGTDKNYSEFLNSKGLH